jgi:hypothetical protein
MSQTNMGRQEASICSTYSHAFHVDHTGLPEIPQKDSGMVGFLPVFSFTKL